MKANELRIAPKNIDEYRPGFWSYKTMPPKWVDYERNWFCQETGKIHHREKEVLKCPNCSKRWYKPNKNEKR